MSPQQIEIKQLIAFLEGLQFTRTDPRFERMQYYLNRLGNHGICSKGYIGCPDTSSNCLSDHK